MSHPIQTPCHCMKMRRSAGMVLAFYNKMLAPSGVTVRQYSLMHAIHTHTGCNVRELSEMAALDRSTLARTLKPLIRQGLVIDRKEPGARDSKLALSEQGETTRQKAGRLWLKAQTEYEHILGQEQLTALEDALLVLQTAF